MIGAGQTSIETVTPAAITSTEVVNATELIGSSATGGAATSTVLTTITQAGATGGSSACSSTKTASADATTTVYTGSYNGMIAKRTASPLDIQPRQATAALASIMNHVFGSTSMTELREAYEVDCLEQVTTYYIATSTESAALVTSTSTASAAVVYVTSTQVVDSSATSSAQQPAVTVTSTVTAQASSNGTSGGVCTVTQGKATATTTQHIKCAPTNLISEIDGYGIGSVRGVANETQGLADGTDPSACCQLCVDTEGCAAVEDDQGAGNCFLYYTTPSCGLGFRYANGGQNLTAGSGFLVQSGCGTIQATSS